MGQGESVEVVFLLFQFFWWCRKHGHQPNVSTEEEVWGFEKTQESVKVVV